MTIPPWMVRLFEHPIRLFLLASVELVLGIGICAWLVVWFADGHDQTQLASRAALILGVLLVVLGVQTLFFGIIALLNQRRTDLDEQR